jgi:hypothetical protein
MRPRFLMEKIETTRLTVLLATITGLAVGEVVRHRIEPRVFAWLVSKGYFGWAEFLAGGTLTPHDRLWPNQKDSLPGS